ESTAACPGAKYAEAASAPHEFPSLLRARLPRRGRAGPTYTGLAPEGRGGAYDQARARRPLPEPVLRRDRRRGARRRRRVDAPGARGARARAPGRARPGPAEPRG